MTLWHRPERPGCKGDEQVFARVIGALARSFLVVALVAWPALVLPAVRVETAQIVVLFALFAGVLTFVEYTARYPGLLEFRYAPPYNRIRFLSLFVIVMMLTAIVREQVEPTTFGLFAQALGALIGQAMDFPYSPVRLVVLMLPDGASPEHAWLVRTAAGVSYLVSLFMLIVFVTALRIGRWPARNAAFNVWVNLPTFDPMVGEDVVARLERDSIINIALGFLLPFLLPAVIKLVSAVLTPITLEGPQTLVWIIAAWAFLPASLLMRGVALARIARMIRARRDHEGAAQQAVLQAI